MKLTRLHFAGAAALAALLLGGCGAKNGSLAAPGALVTLKFNFDKGEKHDYVTTIKTSQSGGSMPMDLTMSMASTVEITDKTDQGFKAKTTISDVKVDAGKDAGIGALIAGAVKAVNGTSIEAAYDSTGKRTEVSTQTNNPSVKVMANSGGLDFGFMGLVCPGKPVSIGSTWDTTVDVGKMMSTMGANISAKASSTLPVKLKLVGVEAGGGKQIAQIAVEVSGTIDFTSSGQPLSVEMNMKGDMHVDVDKGLVTDSDLKTETTIKAAGNTMNQHTEVSSKLKS
jgi:hypothetical protein